MMLLQERFLGEDGTGTDNMTYRLQVLEAAVKVLRQAENDWTEARYLALKNQLGVTLCGVAIPCTPAQHAFWDDVALQVLEIAGV